MSIDIKDFPEYSSGDLIGNMKADEFIIGESYDYLDDNCKHLFSMGIMTRSRNPIQGYNARAFIGLLSSKFDDLSDDLIKNKDEFIEKCKVAAYKTICEIAKFESDYVEDEVELTVCMDFIILIDAPSFRVAIACGNSWVVIHHDVNALPQRPKFTPVIDKNHKDIGNKVYGTIKRHRNLDELTIEDAEGCFRVYSQDKDLEAKTDVTFMAIANRRILTMFNSSPKNFEKDVTDFIGCMMLRNGHSFYFWEKSNKPKVSNKKNVVLMW